jgi:hypothetical protein
MHARANGQQLRASLVFACAAGSLWCSRTPEDSPPEADAINELMAAAL